MYLIFSIGFLLHLQCLSAQADPVACPFTSCHVEHKRGETIWATLTDKICTASHSKVSKWVAYCPYPPELERQSVASAKLELSGLTSKAQKVSDESVEKRSLLRIEETVSDLHANALPVQAEFKLTLNKAKLVAGTSNQKVLPLTKLERDCNLLHSFSLDFDNESFQNWLVANDLHRHSGEKEFAFAWRAFVALRSKYRYLWTQTLDRRASVVCRGFATDCGGLSYLYCSVMRASGLPARPLIGRWARSSSRVEDYSGSFSCHVKSEVYVNAIGWIPVDLALAVANQRLDPKLYFGNDDGDFVVMHDNPDLVFDSLIDGKKHVRSMPDFRVYAQQNGMKTQLSRQITWTVLNKPADKKGRRMASPLQN